MKILVTGSTGFLGLHVVPLLLDRKDPQTGDPITLVLLIRNLKSADAQALIQSIITSNQIQNTNSKPSNLSLSSNTKRRISLLNGRVELFVGDVTNYGDVSTASEGVDVTLNLAGLVIHNNDAESVEDMKRVNVDGLLHCIKSIANNNSNNSNSKRKRVINMSSSGVVYCNHVHCYNRKDLRPRPLEDKSGYSEIAHILPYYKSKIEGECRGSGLARALKVDLIHLRPSMMLGPGDVRGRSTELIASVIERRITAVPRGNGDFVDVRDVATAVVNAIFLPFVPPFPLVLSGDSLPIRSLVQLIDKEYKDLVGEDPARSIPVIPPLVGPPLAYGAASILTFFRRSVGLRSHPSINPIRVYMGDLDWSVSNEAREYSNRLLSVYPRSVEVSLVDTISYILATGRPLQRSKL